MEVGLLIVLPDQGSCSLTVNELNENKIKLFFYESYLNKSEKKHNTWFGLKAQSISK